MWDAIVEVKMIFFRVSLFICFVLFFFSFIYFFIFTGSKMRFLVIFLYDSICDIIILSYMNNIIIVSRSDTMIV